MHALPRFLAGLFVLGVSLVNSVSTGLAEEGSADQAPVYQPPAIEPEKILPGTLKEFRFTTSRIFPGTVRDVTVFVPAQYDGVSDNKVRFLTEELLPFIVQEYQLTLSTDGNDRDMENVAGDWFLLDLEMDKALRFSGYDYQFRVIDGQHVQGYAEHWREAMAYLWRGWPERVQAGPSAPRAQEVLIPGEGWELVAEGFKSTRGPAVNAEGAVYFADTSNNTLHRIEPDGRVGVFAEDAAQAHCVTVGADGAVFTVSEKTDKVMRFDASGQGTVYVDGILGHSLLARPDGSLYVTSNGDKLHGPGSVWLIRDGVKTQVDAGIKFATGMAYRPDQWLLSVAVAIGGAEMDTLYAFCMNRIWKRKIRQHGMGVFPRGRA